MKNVKKLIGVTIQGYLQETRLVAGHHGYLAQCPTSDSSCPTCGQFKELEDSVNKLKSYIQDLHNRVCTLYNVHRVVQNNY